MSGAAQGTRLVKRCTRAGIPDFWMRGAKVQFATGRDRSRSRRIGLAAQASRDGGAGDGSAHIF